MKGLVKSLNNIKGTTRVFGLIGNPVGHSISPVIHNTLADIMGIDLVYTTFKVEENQVEAAVKGAYALDILGMNVTVPHKQAVMRSLKEIDPLAEAIGAVNTLARVDGGYKGYNTDILGLARELEEENVCIKDNPVLIIGAGGAARAIAFLCASRGASSITVINRTVEKAQNIAEAVNGYYGIDSVKAVSIDQVCALQGDGYVAIQTTSVGLYPDVDNVLIKDENFYRKVGAGVDIIYNPYTTRFMKILSNQGKPAYNGLKMLLYQGVAAFEIWNNCSVSKDMADRVYESMKEAMGINE